MEVPRRIIDGYDETMRYSVAAIQHELREGLSHVDYSAPAEQVRTEVTALMDACCGAASDVGARLSSEFYNGLRQMVTGKGGTLSLQTGRNSEATEQAVRAFLKRLFDGDEDGFEDMLLERVELEAKRAAAYNTIDNVRSDPDEPRFARVPQGEKTCDFCLMLASQGPVYLTEESAGAFTKYHAHCVTADTTVNGKGLLAGLRRKYEGPLVRITTRNGRELSVTPNHPILTTSGWVLAGEIKEGYGLVCACFTDGHVAGAPNVQNVPPTAEDVFESCSLVDSTRSGGMPSSAEYLDGEVVADCDVKVVDPYGFLRHAGNAPLCKPVNHGGLSVADGNKSSPGIGFNRDGTGDFLFEGNHPASDRFMCGAGLSGPSFGTHLGCSDNTGVASIANANTGIGENPLDGRPADASAVCDAKDALSTLIRFGHPFRHRGLLAKGLDAIALEHAVDGSLADTKAIRNLLRAFSGEIEVDYVTLLSVSDVSCHVYNLSTAGGWYVASGILTHNCDCKVVPFWHTVSDGASRRRSVDMSIEGYDPDLLYDAWRGKQRFVIPDAKISDYALLDTNKAKAFKKYLGFERGRDDDKLTMRLYAAASTNELQYRNTDQYGDRYYQTAVIEGNDGKKASVCIAWIDRKDGGKMQLTTVYVDV